MCFFQTVLPGFCEGVIQDHSATSKQTHDEPGGGSALKPGGVVAVLRPAEIQCKQGPQRETGEALVMEGV